MKHSKISFDAATPCPAKPFDTCTLRNLGLSLVSGQPKQTAQALLSGDRRVVHFINAHCCNVRAENDAYAAALSRADLLLPDGIGVEIAARLDGQSLAANLNGTDFLPVLSEVAAKAGKSIYLFGGTPGTAKKAAQKLVSLTPSLKIAGTRDGYAQATDTQTVVDDINASGADIVLVALGVPTQELWIDQHAHQIKAPLLMGVGAAFDFLAGNVRRAPRLLRKARLEWIWRLAMEPRRMCRRYVIGNASFLARTFSATLRHADKAQIAQRISDMTIASVALTLLSPVLAATALAVRLDSRGPALFRQTRIGRDGKPFEMIKFRSMHVDAEARQAALLATSDRDDVCFKSKTDPRITRVGRFIRRASIDELPQIFNVLKGEMSIVGPRPALPREVALYPARAMGRLRVKPGITGIWQVAGRADVGFEKMVEMDLTYARTRNLVLDFILILLTFRAVISGRGAY